MVAIPGTLVLHLPAEAAHALDVGAVPEELTLLAQENEVRNK